MENIKLTEENPRREDPMSLILMILDPIWVNNTV